MKKKQKGKYNPIAYAIGGAGILVLFLFTTLIIQFDINQKIKNKLTEAENNVEKEYVYIHVNREGTNEYILNKIVKNETDIYDFYQRYTKDRATAVLIVAEAISHGVPVNLMFALASVESGFTPHAVSKPNTNGSQDLGLFQLNNRVYRRYPKAYLMKMHNNARLAGSHLLHNYEVYGSWEEAIISYNCGNTKKVPPSTIIYLKKILQVESEIDYNLSVALREGIL